MSFGAFQRLPRRVGWKHEYYDGMAHLRPAPVVVNLRPCPAEKSPMQTTPTATAEAAILSRLVKPNRADFSPEVAEALLKLDFDPADRNRMHELAVKGQEGNLTKAEEELDSYRRIGYFVDLMRSKARISLKKHGR
jgi:hypothetical protein